MHASSFLTLAAASFAAAAPLELSIFAAPTTGNFSVTDFVFGCTVGCNWYFNVTVEGEFANHPAVTTPVPCEGSFEDVDYVECGPISETQSVYAYIQKGNETADNLLKLQYTNSVPSNTAYYNYFGEEVVYAATSDKAALQEPEFIVEETSATAVA